MHSTGRGATTTTAGCTTARKWHDDGTPRNPMLHNPAGTSHRKQRHRYQKRTRRSEHQKTSNKRSGMPPETGRNATTTSAQHTSNTGWTQGTSHRRRGEIRTSRMGTDTTETPSSKWEGKELWGHNRRGRGAKKHNQTSIPYGGRYKSCLKQGTRRQKTSVNTGAK